MFVVKSFDSLVENSYSFCADSENIGIPPNIGRPPKLERRDINFLPVPEQFIPLVITSINSVLMTSSNFLSWYLMFGIIVMKYIGLYLNPLTKPEDTA